MSRCLIYDQVQRPCVSGAVNAISGFRYLAWLTAAVIAGFLAAGAFRFGSAVEPVQTNFSALLVLLSLGVASQVGLVAAPWSLSQSSAVRIVVAVLMAPAAILLGLSAWRAAARLVAGNPMSLVVAMLYLFAAVVYSLAYMLLAKASFRHGRKG